MKKIYTMVAAVAIVLSANAQNKAFSGANAGQSTNNVIRVQAMSHDRAPGDTLMWFPSPGAFLFNTADAAAFNLTTEDIDGLTPNNAGESMDFGMYFSDDNTMYGANTAQSNYYHPYESPILSGGTDSSFFWHATSWFSPAGVADNWFMFGPITITSGCTLEWYDRTNPSYRDGYNVKLQLASTVSSPATFTDFSGAAVYTKTDSYPSVTYTTDTTWVLRTAAIPATFNGQSIYVAFNHTANDMDVLYLDDFTIVGIPLGVNEFVNGAKLMQNMPNPASANTTITYQLEKNASVALNVYDVTGKVVASQVIGEEAAGTHNIDFNTANLAAGIYHYALTVDNAKSTAMKMVVIK